MPNCRASFCKWHFPLFHRWCSRGSGRPESAPGSSGDASAAFPFSYGSSCRPAAPWSRKRRFSPLILHHAHPAGTKGGQLGIVAEGWHIDTGFSDDCQNVLLPVEGYALAVDIHDSLCHGLTLLCCGNRAEGAVAHTGAAVDTLFRINGMRLLHRALNCLHGAVLPALAAALALERIDYGVRLLPVADRAVVIHHVRQIFAAEILQRTLNRLAGALAQTAQRRGGNGIRQFLQQIQIFQRTLVFTMRSRISSIRFVPSRQGTHFPQDSFWVNSIKNRAVSTMQVSSSMTTRPPEPIMAPIFSESQNPAADPDGRRLPYLRRRTGRRSGSP